jgi:hypothetical protein
LTPIEWMRGTGVYSPVGALTASEYPVPHTDAVYQFDREPAERPPGGAAAPAGSCLFRTRIGGRVDAELGGHP